MLRWNEIKRKEEEMEEGDDEMVKEKGEKVRIWNLKRR